MCHLVTDHSLEVQKNAYSILQMAARKRTEHLVIEAGVDTESTVKATLPLELLDVIQRHMNFATIDDEDEEQVSTPYSRMNHLVKEIVECLWFFAWLDVDVRPLPERGTNHLV